MKNSRTVLNAAVVALGVAAGSVLLTPATAHAAQSYSNCSAMHADYPHGVGKAGAVDSTSKKTPVTDFTVDNDLYAANSSLDRDDDGIACEK